MQPKFRKKSKFQEKYKDRINSIQHSDDIMMENRKHPQLIEQALEKEAKKENDKRKNKDKNERKNKIINKDTTKSKRRTMIEKIKNNRRGK